MLADRLPLIFRITAALFCGWWSLGVWERVRADEVPVAEKALVAEQVRTHLAGLSSESFETRQAAEESLVKLGHVAFGPLLDSLGQSTSDSAQIILTTLERIWLSAPETLADSLEHQIYDLAWQVGPHQLEFDAILQRNSALIEARAAKTLRRLNVHIKLGPDQNLKELQAEANGVFPESQTQSIQQIVIPRSWKGTSADFWHFHRLRHSPKFHVYYVQGLLSPVDVLTISSRCTAGVDFQERSEVYLGVSSDGFVVVGREGGCLIGVVDPDGTAANAGIQPHDVIQKIDEIPIRDFYDLVDALKTQRCYQEFTVTLLRGDQVLTIPVIGLPWEMRRFECPPPPPVAAPIFESPHSKSLGVPSY